MTAANKGAMDAMMEGMNVILGGGGSKRSKHDKENTPSTTNANKKDDKANKVKCRKKLCPHCKLFVFHKPDRCYELDTNKDKRWVGWKLVKEALT